MSKSTIAAIAAATTATTTSVRIITTVLDVNQHEDLVALLRKSPTFCQWIGLPDLDTCDAEVHITCTFSYCVDMLESIRNAALALELLDVIVHASENVLTSPHMQNAPTLGEYAMVETWLRDYFHNEFIPMLTRGQVDA